MKTASMMLKAMVLVTCLSGSASAQYNRIWEFSETLSNKPAWLAEGLHRGLAYGFVNGTHRLYVAGRENDGTVRILDADSGAEQGALNNTGISGGFFVLNDVEVSNDGVIFACNMTADARSTPFKVYRWDSEAAAPQVVISFVTDGFEETRMGDAFTVVGSAADNSLTIYSVVRESNRAFRFTTNDYGHSFTAAEIHMDAWAGSTPTISPLEPRTSSFYLNSTGWFAHLMAADGSHIGDVEPAAFEGSTRNNASSYIETGGMKLLATYDFDIPGLRLIDVTAGPEDASALASTPSLGTGGPAATAFGSGDVAFRLNEDGTFDLFVLATNVGLAAYRFSLTPEIAVSPSMLDFGEVVVGGNRRLSVTVSNQGLAPLEVSRLALEGSAAFSIVNEAPFILRGGESRHVELIFAPPGAGVFSAVLTVESSDPQTPSLQVTLAGEGTLAPQIAVDPTAISVSLTSGDIETRRVTVSNTGAGPLLFTVSSETAGVQANQPEESGVATARGSPPSDRTEKGAEVESVFAPVAATRGGPDAFGYSWIGSDDPNGPDFSWVSASGGTPIMLHDDDFAAQIPLGFSFSYYGRDFAHLGVGSNGWMTFTGGDGWFPDRVPERGDGMVGAIAPFAFDLDPGRGGYIRYATLGEAPGRTFVVEYNNIQNWPQGNPKTFAVIFYEGSNKIRFQYLTVPDLPIGFGIESPDESTGLGNGGTGDTFISPAVIRNGYAIEFSARPLWLAVEPESGRLEPGESVDLEVTIDASVLLGGSYAAKVVVESNDPAHPRRAVDIALAVTGPPEVSGRVTFDDFPMPGVIMRAEPRNRVTGTDADGAFSFDNLIRGTYTITPHRLGYAFSPESQTVTVGEEPIAGLDFIATRVSETLTEVEPNNSAQQANAIAYGDLVHAAIQPAGDIDYYQFFALAGDTAALTVHVTSMEYFFGRPLLYSSDGALIWAFDVDWSSNASTHAYALPRTDVYYVRYAWWWQEGGFPNSRRPAAEYRVTVPEGLNDRPERYLPWMPPARFSPAAIAERLSEAAQNRPSGPATAASTAQYTLSLNRFAGFPPRVEYSFVMAQFDTQVQMGAYIDPRGRPTEVYIEYGLTESLGSRSEAVTVAGSDEQFVLLPAITGLEPSTRYYYRIVASSSIGVSTSHVNWFNTLDASEGWTRQTSGTVSDLVAVHFSDESTGTVVGWDGSILRTVDGGATWHERQIGTEVELWDVHFASDQIGWVVGSDGTILKTDNGGAEWHQQVSGTNEWLLSVHFLDDLTGIVTGSGGLILRTTDGGLNWSRQFVEPDVWFPGVDFVDNRTGWIVGGYGQVYRTDDAGVTWRRQGTGVWESLIDVSFADANTGIAIGEGGLVLRTVDGGATWSESRPLQWEWLYGVHFLNEQIGIIVGDDGRVLRTENAGRTWSEESSGTTASLYAIHMTGGAAYAVGEFGTILRYEDAGPAPVPANWAVTANTGSSATIVIPSAIEPGSGTRPLRAGDAVGAFFARDGELICAGYGVWDDASDLVFTIWGDDPNTGLKDGFASAEVIRFKFWNSRAARAVDAHPVYESGGTGFEAGAEYILSSLMSGTGVIVFRVDMTTQHGPIAAGAMVGVRGSHWPLDWEYATPMQAAPDEYVYSVRINVDDVPAGTQIEYKFVQEANYQIVWEDRVGPGGPFGNRVFTYPGHSITLPVVYWNNVPWAVSTEENDGIPSEFALHQNYPNPFNPATTIRFDLPQPVRVNLRIFDMLGREIATLVSDEYTAGSHEFNWNAAGVASGAYFYRLEAGEVVLTKKLIVVK